MDLIGFSDIPTRHPRVREMRVDGQLLICHPGQDSAVSLNSSARVIWELCDGKRTLGDISRDIANQLGCSGQALLHDVRHAAASLQQLGMLSLQLGRKTVQSVDWSRMAEPQADQYDAETAWDMISDQALGVRINPAPDNRQTQTGIQIADGAVEVCYCYHGRVPADLIDAQLDHPHISQAVDYLKCWSDGFEQFRRLMRTFHPLVDPSKPCGKQALLTSSRCHSEEGPSSFGSSWSTVNCSLMLAENFAREMAHQKLFALGVYKEHCDRLVANSPRESYVSPMVTDCGRPMTAVLHGVYSFTYVTQLDVRIMENETCSQVLPPMISRLQANLSKLAMGLPEIQRNIRVDESGQVFMGGLYAWIERLMVESQQLLGTAPRTMGTIKTVAIVNNVIPHIRTAVVQHDFGDDALFYIPEQETAMALNSSSRQVYGLCDGCRTVTDIVAELADRHGLPPEHLLGDVTGAVLRFAAEGLIDLVGSFSHELLHSGDVESVGIRFANYRVAVRSTAPEVLHEIRTRFGAMAEELNEPADVELYVQRSAGEYIFCRQSGDRLQMLSCKGLDFIKGEIVHLIAAAHADMLWLHAGAATDESHTVLVCGTNGSGKSTLVAGLAARGWQYFSDDIVPVDASGKAVPFPLTPITRQPTEYRLPDIRLGELKRQAVHVPFQFISQESAAIDLLLFPEFDPIVTPGVISCSRAECAQRLLRNCVSWNDQGVVAVDAAVNLARQTPGARLIYNCAESATQLLLEYIELTVNRPPTAESR